MRLLKKRKTVRFPIRHTDFERQNFVLKADGLLDTYIKHLTLRVGELEEAYALQPSILAFWSSKAVLEDYKLARAEMSHRHLVARLSATARKVLGGSVTETRVKEWVSLQQEFQKSEEMLEYFRHRAAAYSAAVAAMRSREQSLIGFGACVRAERRSRDSLNAPVSRTAGLWKPREDEEA